MYKAYLQIDDLKLPGTLDMYVIKRTQEELYECNKLLKVHEIFEGIAQMDFHCIAALILQSVLRVSGLDEEEFIQSFKISFIEFFDWVKKGKVTDVKTIIAAFWLEKIVTGQWNVEKMM